MIGQKMRGPQDEIVGIASGERCRRTADLKRQLCPRLKPQIIARAGKRHEAFQIMIAVRPASEHVERQIDLGGRTGGERQRHGASMPESEVVGKS